MARNASTTQLDQIKAHLVTGRSITALEALGLYGVFRLAARIKELRNKGWEIETEIKHDISGKVYAEYTRIGGTDPKDLPAFARPDWAK
jgi:hypothetical protein